MATFNFKSTSQKKTYTTSGFLGVDFTNNLEATDMRRSPNAVNMIRETPGKNKKRGGFATMYTFPGEINGIHLFESSGVKKLLIHSGTELYIREGNGYTSIYNKMNDARSMSTVLNGKLIIIDGKAMLSYDGETLLSMSSIAYIPTIVIGRSPSGGGKLHEPINMIGDKRIEKFTADGSSRKYYLTTDDIYVINYVRKRKESGEWESLNYDVHYDYNEAEGTVTFFDAPAAPKDGADNIMICYIKYNNEYKSMIYSCNICTLYGINGNMDRIFLTGNEKYPNRDYYCQVDDPTYWGDTWYSSIGKSNSPIIGYSIVSDCLAVHKAGEESNANIILRQGKIVDGEPCFPVVGTYTSGNAVASDTFGMLDNEPVYLAEDGISAITPSDVLGERFSQVRSYFLNPKLLSEGHPENASAVSYKGFYMLLLNENMYILDGLQSVASSGKPFSHRQYEAYFWENIPGKFLFTDGEILYMAGKNGKLCRYLEESTSDDEAPVFAYWEFNEFFGDDFSRLKTITHIDVMVDSGAKNIVLEYRNENGEWRKISETGSASSDKIISKKVHIKDCGSIKLRIRNLLNGDLKLDRLKISFINGKKIK